MQPRTPLSADMPDAITEAAKSLKVMTEDQRKLRLEAMGDHEREMVKAEYRRLFGERVITPPEAKGPPSHPAATHPVGVEELRDSKTPLG